MALRSRATTTVLALGLGQTLGWASCYYLLAILASPIAAELGTSVAWVFGALSVALLVSALLGPTVGRVIDRHGGRGLLLASNGLFALGLAAMALAPNLPAFLLAWGLVGVAMACGLYDAAFATLARLQGGQARRAITAITLMGGLASTLGWPLTAWLEARWGWRIGCGVWAAVHLLVALPVHWLGVPAAPPLPTATADTEAARPIPRLTLALLAYVFAAGWCVSTAMAAHLPGLLQASGVPLAAAVAAGVWVGPAQVLARALELGLLGRIHPLVSATLATTLHPLAAWLLLGWGAPAWLFAVLHGAGNGLLTVAVGTLPLALFGAAGYGQRQGWLNAPSRLAQAASPVLFALLVERLGGGALWVSSALLGLACACLLWLALRLRSR